MLKKYEDYWIARKESKNSITKVIKVWSEREAALHDAGFEKGAEFGYNKCKEEMQKNGLALQSDMDKTIEQNVVLKKELEKTKWHKVSEQLPTEEKNYLVKFTDGTVDVFYVGIDGNLEPFILTTEGVDFFKDVEKWCEIPKERI